MNRNGFKHWLVETNTYTSDIIRKDCVSRAKRVEKAFADVFPDFSYENEYKKDRAQSFLKLLKANGRNIDFAIDLPVRTNQMCVLSAAAKKYIQYLAVVYKQNFCQ